MKTDNNKNIKITDGFWKVKQDMVRDVTLKSVYDRFEETHRFDALNCTWKEGDPDMPHVFWDSDIAKWIEGLATALIIQKTRSLKKSPMKQLKKSAKIVMKTAISTAISL